jgi:dTDP-4-dehydrorhamnose reductase
LKLLPLRDIATHREIDQLARRIRAELIISTASAVDRGKNETEEGAADRSVRAEGRKEGRKVQTAA